MFGANPLRKREHGDGQSLLLQGKPFSTIQGEGPYAGYPATFVRLWGCHLACFFCDTDFESDPRALDIVLVVEQCQRNGHELVVLTGGEPLRQNIEPLAAALLLKGFHVQIETAGTLWVPGLEQHKMDKLSIVVSPKTFHVHEYIASLAASWKYIISERQVSASYDGLPITNTQNVHGSARPLARPRQGSQPQNIFVQPMDEQNEEQNKLNQERCIYLAKHFGYRVSLQQHKILNVP